MSTPAPAATGTATPSSSPPQSPYSDSDTVLMAKGDCYGSVPDNAPGRVEEMACDAPDAIGKVLKRAKEKTTQDTYIDCPDSTDDVLGISDTGGPELAGSRDYTQYVNGIGYACVRNLKAPHPGDPGGGGMEIRVGDCLWTEGPDDQYREVPCEGETLPDLKIVGDLDLYGNCPREDDIQLTEDSFLSIAGLEGPTYCARRL
ncbi:hypothetical protein [Streptomyces sp. NBC_00038]|uniref:hypothetical protein n=1 Tax=Streptomyces sp. NBC_00038 TaxID=2903615 RepID=UPI002259B01F|nr:hypothetical protein [Streptomyces sp. NBC_00038]MCX5561161.1 hypothetical protein [Streptomyces sp. NBC_00038]